jgi:hypothetical protein
MWPFGSKSSGRERHGAEDGDRSREASRGQSRDETDAPSRAGEQDQDRSRPASGAADGQTGSTYDPVDGSFGPFDGDQVNYRDFDFSDFAKGGLDLGSMMVPVPHQGEVQVEMGPQGPQMIHIVTPVGRLTPVAFAAPRSGGMWEESLTSLEEGMVKDGLAASRGTNLWGEEIIGTAGNGQMRVIGVDGPRWMLRVTLAGPADTADELAALAYDVISRTFVNRGDSPVPAGQPLPVTIPAAMAEELKKAVEQQNQQAQQQNQQQAQTADGGASDAAAGASAEPERPARRTTGTADGRMGDAG